MLWETLVYGPLAPFNPPLGDIFPCAADISQLGMLRVKASSYIAVQSVETTLKYLLLCSRRYGEHTIAALISRRVNVPGRCFAPNPTHHAMALSEY